MKLKLNELASIHSGYTFRSGVKSNVAGQCSVIQMKDLRGDGLIDCNDLAQVVAGRFSSGNMALRGDLVFRSRGMTFTSAILDKSIKNCVVAAPLYRIRVEENSGVQPGYLNWFLGQPVAVVVPGMKRQKAIVRVVSLARRENQIVERIQFLRNRNVASILADCIKGD